MNIKEQLNQDLKTAMLSGDKTLVTTLRGLKSVILYAEVALAARDDGMPDSAIIELFAKESKKRQESADLFTQGGNLVKAAEELKEKEVIAAYLPEQLSDKELDELVTSAIATNGPLTKETMGKIIGAVKAKAGAEADGGRIAQAVKAKI